MTFFRASIFVAALAFTSQARAQVSIRDLLEGPPPESGANVRLEGDDGGLQLREYLGMAVVGSLYQMHTTSTGRTYGTTTPVQRRQYSVLGHVGDSIALRPGRYALTVGGAYHPMHLHEAHVYYVDVDPDVVALRLAYVDRRPQRLRRWLVTSGLAVLGGLLCWISTIDGIETSGYGINRPLMFTGIGLATSFQFSFMIPLFTRDDARIDVVHADGSAMRARRRVRN